VIFSTNHIVNFDVGISFSTFKKENNSNIGFQTMLLQNFKYRNQYFKLQQNKIDLTKGTLTYG
jgi:hypothetical protein